MNTPETFPQKTIDRFLKFIERVPFSDCWYFLGKANNFGHCQFAISGTVPNQIMEGAHRFAYRAFKSAFPRELCVLHRCDEPCCVNPDHLFLGTRGDNNTDRKRKGRNSDRRGERHHMCRFSDAQCDEMRRLCASGLSQWAVARMFATHQTTISSIVRGVRRATPTAPRRTSPSVAAIR